MDSQQEVLPIFNEITGELLNSSTVTTLDLSGKLGQRFNNGEHFAIDEHDRSTAITSCVRLTKLILGINNIINDNGIKNLTSLEILGLRGNHMITNDGIAKLVNLKELDLGYNDNIDKIDHLTKLESLNLDSNKIITDAHIKRI